MITEPKQKVSVYFKNKSKVEKLKYHCEKYAVFYILYLLPLIINCVFFHMIKNKLDENHAGNYIGVSICILCPVMNWLIPLLLLLYGLGKVILTVL